jgi:hypothetical protein
LTSGAPRLESRIHFSASGTGLYEKEAIMMKSKRKLCFLRASIVLFVAAMVSESLAQPQEPLLSLAKKESPPYSKH